MFLLSVKEIKNEIAEHYNVKANVLRDALKRFLSARL